MRISPAAKVGILTLLSVIILIFGIMWLKGRSISAGERIEVQFHDVDGMRPGSAVQMMGIRIGQVEEVFPVINVDSSYVKVRFVITEPNISIPCASIISIQQSGIIGEKFLEITPPQEQIVYLPITHNLKTLLMTGIPVDLLVNNKYIKVGEIKNTEIVDTKTLTSSQKDSVKTSYAYKIGYIITKPGIIVPDGTDGKILTDGNKYKLRLTPSPNFIAQITDSSGKYTIIEPMRLKKFFDVQLQSAIALQETNDKINSLLSEESIGDLKTILKNTKSLTAEADKTLTEATALLSSSKTEMDNLVILATNLSTKMVMLADNINDFVGDPEVKNNLLTTTTSIQKSANSISTILDDPKLQETFQSLNGTAKDLSEITTYMSSLTKDDELKTKLDSTIINLNSSLVKLSDTLDTINGLDSAEKKKLEGIVNDSAEISGNLKKFSDKLNKRFLLFRLMF